MSYIVPHWIAALIMSAVLLIASSVSFAVRNSITKAFNGRHAKLHAAPTRGEQHVSETTGEIQGRIRDRQEDLKENILELEQKVKSATDWRQHFDKSPGMFLAAALGGGLLLALVTNSRRARIVYAPAPARAWISLWPRRRPVMLTIPLA